MYQFTSSWNRSTKSNLSTNFSLVLWTLLSSSFFHYIIFIHFTQGHCSSLGYCHHFLWLVFLRCSTSGICILCYLTIWKIILWPVKIRFLFFSPPPRFWLSITELDIVLTSHNIIFTEWNKTVGLQYCSAKSSMMSFIYLYYRLIMAVTLIS